METIKLVKLACGKHWADPSKKQAGDPCSKCAYFARQEAADRKAGLLQHNGTPWIAILGDPFPKPDWWTPHGEARSKG